MDRKIFDRIKSLFSARKLLVLGTCAAFVGSVGWYVTHQAHVLPAGGTSVASSSPESHESRESRIVSSVKDAFHMPRVPRLLEPYVLAWKNFQHKVDELQRAEEENRKLVLENARLKVALETSHFSCMSEKTAKQTSKVELKLSQETGSRVGRTLASIPYAVPSNLMPQQLYTLAMSYFKGRDDEKAAVLFTFLTGLEDVNAYKTPANYLMTAVSWYRLDNFELADQYFEKVLNAPEQPENLRYMAQARLWKGLASARLGKHVKAQFWLRDLVDHHPQSREAKWVNSAQTREVGRATASVADQQ